MTKKKEAPKLDFEKVDAEAKKPEDRVAIMVELIEESDLLDKQRADLQEQIDSIGTRYNHIKTKLLPDIMAELKVDEWKTGGVTVVLENFVSGSLPKKAEERAEAIKWLEENEAGSLIHSDLTIEFTKSQHNEALALVDDLTKQGYAPTLVSTVHPQTLLANVREWMRDGREVPLKTLGVFSGLVAKVKHPKRSKKEKQS